MASSTVTSAPRRRQTLPSSRPITPAPMTPRRFGTASNSSAPQESTMRLPSNGRISAPRGRARGEDDMLCGQRLLRLPSCASELDLAAARRSLPCHPAGDDARGLEQRGDAASHALDDAGLALLHGGDVERQGADLDAMRRELVRARWKSSEDSSSAFEGMQPAFRQVPPNAAAVVVLPVVDAGDLQLVLRRRGSRRDSRPGRHR
jgi:hypothetical protein